MNTITQNSMVHVAMDGQTLYKSASIKSPGTESSNANIIPQSITPTGAQAAQSLEQTLAETKASVQELQKMSEMVAGSKIQFSINKELGSVVVSIVDASTNQVVKQIPSEDMQKLKLRIRKAIGNIFDEVV